MASQPTTTVKLDPETKARLQRLGELRRRSPHWLMREAIAHTSTRKSSARVCRRPG